jgi:hypothetical protein
MEYDKRHGGPYDRGSADSYYGRPRAPHYYKNASLPSGKIEQHRVRPMDMTDEELAAYNAGYDDNEANGDKKDWS